MTTIGLGMIRRQTKTEFMGKVIYQGQTGTVKFNEERRIVEIYFNSRPSDETIGALKVLNWRYFGKSRCWYNRNNPENVELAISICGEAKEETTDRIDYYIGPDEVMVVTSIRSCIYKEHALEKGTASVNVLRYGSVVEMTVPIFYCSECQVYYLYENDFSELRSRGTVCARVLTLNEYRRINSNGWEPVSIMRSYGYTVNAQDNLSDQARRSILAFLIENEIISAERLIDYLAWFSRTHRSQENMESARSNSLIELDMSYTTIITISCFSRCFLL